MLQQYKDSVLTVFVTNGGSITEEVLFSVIMFCCSADLHFYCIVDDGIGKGGPIITET